MTKIKPPTKASDLIELALADLRKVEADERYKVNMGTWHESPLYDVEVRPCEVCMAGAVMAKSLGASPEYDFTPSSFGEWTFALRAIDNFRIGAIESGLDKMYIYNDRLNLPDIDVPNYNSRDPEPFHRAMHEMARMFRDAGV